MQTAPLFDEDAESPDEGHPLWVRASDGLRLRLVHWGGTAPKGTVLLFPGRTEYIEKYGPTAVALRRSGYATLVIDWRGQGLSDRIASDTSLGHVLRFSDYQRDVRAMIETAQALELPRPWHLLAHSMGGCIGLRALHEGLDVVSAGFSAPMWGIRMANAARPAAWALSWSGARLGQGHRYAPGTNSAAYVLAEGFEGNMLTTDPEMFEMMRRQTDRHPELQLGGPSLQWLNEALSEMRALARKPAPPVPCLAFLGENERIVDPARIRDRMADWPGGTLVEIAGAEHEVLMERAEIRNEVLARLTDFYDAAAPAGASDSARTAPQGA